MHTTTEPLLLNSITPSLRLYQNMVMAILLLLSLVCFAGWLFWCTTADDIEFTRFMAWFLLGFTVLMFLIRQCYKVSFWIDGQGQQVIRSRHLLWWKWTREFPSTNYTAVHSYHIENSDLDGYCLELIGKDRLRLLFAPTGRGITELAEMIASTLQLPYYQDHRTP